MRQIRLLACTILPLLALASPLSARYITPLSPKELNDKSDLIVIAVPTSTGKTDEKIANFHGFAGQPAVGVETKFAVLTVLKGDSATQSLILHHYKADGLSVINAPSFVSFDPTKEQQYLLFLVREADGRYAPTAGQVDPELYGIYALTMPHARP